MPCDTGQTSLAGALPHPIGPAVQFLHTMQLCIALLTHIPERGILLQGLNGILRKEQRDARHAYREIAYVVSEEALRARAPLPQHLQCLLPCSCMRKEAAPWLRG